MLSVAQPSFHLGTAGWAIPAPFRHHFPGSGSVLQRYAEQLNAVEINSTFYRLPRAATLARWRDETPAHFRFSVKLPGQLTHEARLRRARAGLNEFLRLCRELQPKLSVVLVQLPKSFEYESRVARTFLELLRAEYGGSVVWEPRHPSWFTARVTELLLRYDSGRVAADPACVPEASRPQPSSGVVYFRLHGSPEMYRSNYERAYLEHLAAAARGYAAQGYSTWFMFDNTTFGAATKNALELSSLLEVGAQSPV